MNKMEKTLIMSTTEPSLRSEVCGWSAEDASLYVAGKPIGLTPGPKFRYWDYHTVLQAQANGWRLLGPPMAEVIDEEIVWSWWLVK